MSSRVLDAVLDATEWRDVLLRLPESQRDIYFTPEWLALHRRERSITAHLYAYESGSSVLAYPFLLRSFSRIGERALGETLCDLETAYGYGGPVASGAADGFLAEAWSAFDAWCKAHRVVAEFVRLHPLLDNGKLLPAEARRSQDRETISIDLVEVTEGAEPYSAKARNMIRRALRSGATVVSLSGMDALEQFRQMYEATMRRLGAGDFYYFGDHYFQWLGRLVETDGVMLGVQHEGQCVAAAMFLKGPRWMHYHLAASEKSGRVPGAMNLLLHEAARLGASLGLELLHLGGGTTADTADPLFLFKRSMGTQRHVFQIAKRVRDQEKYDELGRIWREVHNKTGPEVPNKLLYYHDHS
jgi:hypothetical protein